MEVEKEMQVYIQNHMFFASNHYKISVLRLILFEILVIFKLYITYYRKPVRRGVRFLNNLRCTGGICDG